MLTTLPLWLPVVGTVFLGRQVQKAGAALIPRKPSGQVRARAQTLSSAHKTVAAACAIPATGTHRRASAATQSENTIVLPGNIRTGWLTKLGEKPKTWRRRYFVITPDVSGRDGMLMAVLAMRPA